MQSVLLKVIKMNLLKVLQNSLKIPHFDQTSDIRLRFETLAVLRRPRPFITLVVIVLGRPKGRQERGLSCPAEPCARPYTHPSYTSK